MADGFVQLAPDSTGKKADVNELTVGSNVVERQRINISSPTDPNGHAEVMNEPPPNPDTTYALLVRQIQEDNAYTQELLGQIASALAQVIAQKALGVVGVQVAQAQQGNLNATVNVQWVGGNNTANYASVSPNGVASMPVAINSSYPMPGVPQHIYGGLSV